MHEKRKNNSAANIALLAPVPLEHLRLGRKVVANEGRVAFGSQRFDLFRQLDSECKRLPVDVYIYASHCEGHSESEPFWVARYIGHVESDLGAHPGGMRVRPKSTTDDTAFAVFWEVDELNPVAQSEWCHLAGLTGFGKKKPYGRPFIPEGPILIEHP